MLANALKYAHEDPLPLVEAMYWLETSIWMEGGPTMAASSLVKNAGLGHVHMVQNKQLSNEKPLPKPSDVHHSLQQIGWPSTRYQ